ncbi:DDT domain-containing protein DDR4 [Bienertia sinuspersici]
MDTDHNSESLDRSNRRRQRPQRYSEKEFVEAISDNEQGYFDSDDDIVGEAVYDDEYMQQRKQKKRLTSSSEGEGDEEYNWSEENGEDEVEEEEEDDSLSISEDSDQPRGRLKRPEGRTRRGAKTRAVDDLDSGLRRSNEPQGTTSMKHGKENTGSERHNDATNIAEYSMESQDSDEGNEEGQEERGTGDSTPMDVEKDENGPVAKSDSPKQDDSEGIGATRGFLDLNELAPGSGFDDGPSALVKDDDQKRE